MENIDAIKKIADVQRFTYEKFHKLEGDLITVKDCFMRDIAQLKYELAQSQGFGTDKIKMQMYLIVAVKESLEDIKVKAFLSAKERDTFKREYLKRNFIVHCVDEVFDIDVVKSLAEGFIREVKK